MSACFLLSRGLRAPSKLLRPSSRLLSNTSTTTSGSNHPPPVSITAPKTAPQRQNKHSSQPNTTFQIRRVLPKMPYEQKDMTDAEAKQRIDVCKTAISQLDQETPDAKPKKLRHRAVRRMEHVNEINRLMQQLDLPQSTQSYQNRQRSSQTYSDPSTQSDMMDYQQTPSSCQAPNPQFTPSNSQYSGNPASQDYRDLPGQQYQDSPSSIRSKRTPNKKQYGWGKEEIVKTRSPMSEKDPIKAPSPASGGVPEPMDAYIAQAAQPLRLAPEPQHILVIIDLNGALIHRPSRLQPTRYIARQSTDLFLDYVFSRFQVMVWSAARPNNVDAMCSQLFPGRSRQKLLAEWGRDKMGLSQADYNSRTQVYKRLETIWDDSKMQAKHPLRDHGGRWSQANTVLIDDSTEKARSHPYNLIKVPEFEGQRESEDVLRAVAEYLDDLLVQMDISACIKANPFRFNHPPSHK